MKKYLLFITFMASLTLTPHALATSKAIIKGGVCVSNNFNGGDSIFICDHIGQNTISQIYEKGWKVVTYSQHMQFKNTVTLVIEQQG